MQAYVYAKGNGDEKIRATAVSRFIEHGAKSPAVVPLLATLYPPEYGDLFAKVAEHHPDKVARGNALFFLTQCDLDRIYRPEEAIPPRDQVARLDDRLRRVEQDFGPVKCLDETGRTLGESVRGERAKLKAVAPGSTAPEFAGRPLDDKEFKLSECRGRVVVLVFVVSAVSRSLARRGEVG